MSAYWIADRIGTVPATMEVKALSKTVLEIRPRLGDEPMRIYVVSGEYFLDQEVVARAIAAGAQHVAYFELTRTTTAGDEFAMNNGIKRWPVGRLLGAARNGRL